MLEGSGEGGWKVVDMMVCGDGGGPLGVKEMMMMKCYDQRWLRL